MGKVLAYIGFSINHDFRYPFAFSPADKTGLIYINIVNLLTIIQTTAVRNTKHSSDINIQLSLIKGLVKTLGCDKELPLSCPRGIYFHLTLFRLS